MEVTVTIQISDIHGYVSESFILRMRIWKGRLHHHRVTRCLEIAAARHAGAKQHGVNALKCSGY